MHFIRLFLLAVQFFTRIPITGRLADWVGFSPDMLRSSAVFFPAVGAVVGLFGAAVFALFHALFDGLLYAGLLAATLSTAATAWLTGAFHEDGLADTADALGGHVSTERALEIMKDSRIGTYGSVTLLLVVLCKVLLLASLGTADATVAVGALVAGHVASRWGALGLVRFLPHVGNTSGSKSKPLADSMSGAAFGWASVTCALLLVPLLWWFDATFFVGALLAVPLVAWRMGVWLRKRLGGFTGDGLGATQQMCELAIYLAICISAAQLGAG